MWAPSCVNLIWKIQILQILQIWHIFSRESTVCITFTSTRQSWNLILIHQLTLLQWKLNWPPTPCRACPTREHRLIRRTQTILGQAQAKTQEEGMQSSSIVDLLRARQEMDEIPIWLPSPHSLCPGSWGEEMGLLIAHPTNKHAPSQTKAKGANYVVQLHREHESRGWP